LVDKIILHGLSVAIVAVSVLLVYFVVQFVSVRIFDERRAVQDADRAAAIMSDFFTDIRETPFTHVENPYFAQFAALLEAGNAPADVIILAPPPNPPQMRSPLEYITALRAEFNNNDIIGHINIPHRRDGNRYAARGPLLIGPDNDFYLYRTPERRSSAAGSLFLDFRNSPMFTDHNTVIYGHAMAGGSMFGQLRDFRDATFRNDHLYIEIATMYEFTVWRVFASYYIMIQGNWFNYIQPNFDNRQTHQEFLNEIEQRARAQRPLRTTDGGLFFLDVGVTPDDLIITLSTCTNWHEDQRQAIHAVLVERNGLPMR